MLTVPSSSPVCRVDSAIAAEELDAERTRQQIEVYVQLLQQMSAHCVSPECDASRRHDAVSGGCTPVTEPLQPGPTPLRWDAAQGGLAVVPTGDATPVSDNWSGRSVSLSDILSVAADASCISEKDAQVDCFVPSQTSGTELYRGDVLVNPTACQLTGDVLVNPTACQLTGDALVNPTVCQLTGDAFVNPTACQLTGDVSLEDSLRGYVETETPAGTTHGTTASSFKCDESKAETSLASIPILFKN